MSLTHADAETTEVVDLFYFDAYVPDPRDEVEAENGLVPLQSFLQGGFGPVVASLIEALSVDFTVDLDFEFEFGSVRLKGKVRGRRRQKRGRSPAQEAEQSRLIRELRNTDPLVSEGEVERARGKWRNALLALLGATAMYSDFRSSVVAVSEDVAWALRFATSVMSRSGTSTVELVPTENLQRAIDEAPPEMPPAPPKIPAGS
jgi:hypothetical protein